MRIEPNENALNSQLIINGKQTIINQIVERIHWLTHYYLVEIALDDSGWSRLYKDPEDGRYWELSFPNSEVQGGGPPSLTIMPLDKALVKYSIF